MLKEFAPAKINLFLDILSKRPDGYHDLGTLFQTVAVGDDLFAEEEKTPRITVRYNIPQAYSLEEDLVYRAAKLLQETFGVKYGASFYLEKKMPLGAGLGGGSADAAAALRLLNRLWNLNLSPEELEKFGAKLGADVPFLVRGGTALAEGIGDVLTHLEPLELPDEAALLIATPKCSVPTRAAYAGCVPSGNSRWEIFRQSDFQNFRDFAFNKFEETVLPQFPQISRMKLLLENAGAEFALMSGSGASVFGVFDKKSQAEKAARLVDAEARFVAVTRFFSGIFLTMSCGLSKVLLSL